MVDLMAQTKTLPVGIAGGMREDISEHNAPPGTLVDAKNVRFSTVGEVEARPGTVALSIATDTDVTYLEAFGNEPGVLAPLPGGFYVGAQGFGFRYDDAKERLHISGSYANAEPRGIWETMAREEQVLASGKASPWPLSQAAVNGYVATVCSDGNAQPIGDGTYDVGPGSRQSLILHVRTTDGTLVLSAEIPSATGAWLVADGSSLTNLVLVYQDTTTGLNARVITTSATGATLGSAVSVGTLTGATSFWAACNFPSLGWLLIHQSAAAVATITAFAGTASFDSVTFAVTGNVPLSIFATAANVYAGWVEGSGAPFTASARVYDTSLNLTSGVGAVTIATEVTLQALGPPLFGPSTTSSSAMFIYSRCVDERITEDTWVNWGELTSTGTVAIDQRINQCTAASAPFANGYVWVRMGSNQATHGARYTRYALLDFMGMRIGATGNTRQSLPAIALTGVAFSDDSNSGYPGGFYLQHLSPPCVLSDGSYVMGLPRLVRLAQVSGSDVGLAISEWLRFSLGGQRNAAPLGDELIVAGSPTLVDVGIGTRAYDGASNTFSYQRAGVDLGFPVRPGLSAITKSNGAGNLTNSGVYQWRAVLEWIDSNSVRWRSAPSAISSATLGSSDDTAEMTGRASVSFLRAIGGSESDEPGSRIVMHFYRTTNGGSTFYRCTPPQGAPTAATFGVFSFTDLSSDSDIQVNEILYTDGGVLQNDFPPSCRFIRCTEDRVWLAGLWETEQLQSSKILVPGEPPQFSDSPAFRVVLPEACTGIAIQDGVVVAFTARGVYGIQGSGPNDQGQGAWDSPRCITRSTGGRPLLETSIGIFFQSAQGIEIVPRGLGEPQFIGMPVQSQMYDVSTEAMLQVTSASVVTTPQGRTARFVLDDGTAAGRLLVLDLDTMAWSRDVYGSRILAVCDTDEGAVMQLGDATSGYGLLREDISEDQDSVGSNPAEISCSLEWAELRPFGPAGMGRFHSATALFDEKESPSSGYRSGNATITLSVDRSTETGKVFNMSNLESTDYQAHVPTNDAGTMGKLTLSTTVGGWRFVGWTVATDDHGGPRRMGETEQG